MSLPGWLLWVLAIAGLALGVDRVLLWMEARGWIYYRRTKNRGGGAVYHLLETHSVFDPSAEEIIEVKYGEEQRQDESGDPPGPDGEGSGDEEADGGAAAAPPRRDGSGSKRRAR